MSDEPFGHRGHPSEVEVRRAAKVAIRLRRAVDRLCRRGFSEQEAVAFIAGIAHARGLDEGESWTEEHNAIRTVEGLLAGRGAKEWSINVVILALFDVAGLLE